MIFGNRIYRTARTMGLFARTEQLKVGQAPTSSTIEPIQRGRAVEE
jgi:hypothetical protein